VTPTVPTADSLIVIPFDSPMDVVRCSWIPGSCVCSFCPVGVASTCPTGWFERLQVIVVFPTRPVPRRPTHTVRCPHVPLRFLVSCYGSCWCHLRPRCDLTPTIPHHSIIHMGCSVQFYDQTLPPTLVVLHCYPRSYTDCSSPTLFVFHLLVSPHTHGSHTLPTW